jgi:hypothetical protein
MERFATFIAVVPVISPFAAFLLAVRQPQSTAGKTIGATALAGFAGGTAFFVLEHLQALVAAA